LLKSDTFRHKEQLCHIWGEMFTLPPAKHTFR
jgi:hypothetical protein